jgi:hypothetical protein
MAELNPAMTEGVVSAKQQWLTESKRIAPQSIQSKFNCAANFAKIISIQNIKTNEPRIRLKQTTKREKKLKRAATQFIVPRCL